MPRHDSPFPSSALDSLFNTLKTHGASFRADFWDSVCQRVLFPIFAPLRSGPMQEEMSFWVSTTMVTALRNLVDLYTFYFEILERFLDPLLDLLCFCIDQGEIPCPSPCPLRSSF
jgi:brefeldin A-inhibited guanine nucleotide-exchange protein